MGMWALICASLLYFVAAIDLARRKDASMAIVFGAYGVANAALLYASYRQPILAWIKAWL